MKMITKIMLFLGLILFLVSFFMPAIALTPEMKLSGFEAFVVNTGMIYFIDNTAAYFEWVFMLLTNVWAVFLFLRFWRKGERKIITYIVGILAIISALYWMFKMEDGSVLLMGYWLWLFGISSIVLANILKKNEAK